MINQIKYWYKYPASFRWALRMFVDGLFEKFLPKMYAARELALVKAPRVRYNRILVDNQAYYRTLPTPVLAD